MLTRTLMKISLLIGVISFGLISISTFAQPTQARDFEVVDCAQQPILCKVFRAIGPDPTPYCETLRGKLDPKCSSNPPLPFCEDPRYMKSPICNPIDEPLIMKQPPVCLSCPIINTNFERNESLLVTNGPEGSILISKIPNNLTAASNFINLSNSSGMRR